MMNELKLAVGVCLLLVLILLVLRQSNGSGAAALLIGAVTVLSLRGLTDASAVFRQIEELQTHAAVSDSLYVPVLKIAVIGAAVRITGAICRDSGVSALAAQLELIGTCAALAVCLPLFRQVLEVADALLG